MLAAGEWQPGETAPKDGSTFLGLWDGELYLAHWYWITRRENRGGWSRLDKYGKRWIGDEPSHWVAIVLPTETKR